MNEFPRHYIWKEYPSTKSANGKNFAGTRGRRNHAFVSSNTGMLSSKKTEAPTFEKTNSTLSQKQMFLTQSFRKSNCQEVRVILYSSWFLLGRTPESS